MRVGAICLLALALFKLQAPINKRSFNGCDGGLNGAAAWRYFAASWGTRALGVALATTLRWFIHLVRKLNNPMFVFALISVIASAALEK